MAALRGALPNGFDGFLSQRAKRPLLQCISVMHATVVPRLRSRQARIRTANEGVRVRRVSRIIFALSVSLSAGSVAQAREQLVMPFDYSIERGRLEISHAANKSYMPADDLGAGFVPVPLASDASGIVVGAAGTPGETLLMPLAGSTDKTVIAKADPYRGWRPLLDPVTREAGLAPNGSGSEWVTVVRSGDDATAEISAVIALGAGSLAWLLVVMTIATVTLLVRARTSPEWAKKTAAISPNLASLLMRLGLVDFSVSRIDGEVGRNLTGAGRAVAAILDQAETEVAQLKDAGPLREVLLSELALVDRRLANVNASAAEGKEIKAKSGPKFRLLVRDLERLRRIADSAAASFSSSRNSSTLPKTKSEAYAILGVNSDVSESVLKKIIDALRMSWHPDHARDEADLRLREDRIRQINIACDLINENRELA